MSSLAPHLNPQHFYGRLIFLKLPTNEVYRFQNFQIAPYSFEGSDYIYLPFVLTTFVEDLEISSTSMSLKLANTEALRAILKEKELRGSLMKVYTVFPEDEDAIYETQNTRISSYVLQKGAVVFTCRSPVDAVFNQIPSKVFEPDIFPELPYVNRVKTNYRPL